MKNKILIVNLCMIFILFTQLVSADLILKTYSNDFSINSNNKDLFICGCESRTDYIELLNYGNVPGKFNVYIESQNSDFIDVINPSFKLLPSQNTRIPIQINIPCSYKGGFQYEIIVKSDTGRERSLLKTVRASSCQNIVADINSLQENPHQCQDMGFKIDIHNAAPFRDTYTISTNLLDFTKFSENNIQIHPGETETVYANIRLPCDILGKKEISFNIHSNLNNNDIEIKKSVNIVDRSDFDMNLQKSGAICSKLANEVYLKIKNTGEIIDSFEYDISGAEFLAIEKKEIILEKEETAEIPIIITPKGLTGDYTLKAQVRSLVSGKIKTEELKFKVDNCYDAEINFINEKSNENSKNIELCCNDHTLEIEIRNKGSLKETFILSTISDLSHTTNPSSVTLNPNEAKIINSNIVVPCTNDDFKFKINVESIISGKTFQDDIKIKSSDTLECYYLDIQNSLEFSHNKDIQTLEIKSTGLDAGVYDVWLISDILSTNTDSINLAKDSSKKLKIDKEKSASPGIYQAQMRLKHSESDVEYVQDIRVNIKKVPAFISFFSHLASDAVCIIFFLLFIIGSLICLFLILKDLSQNTYFERFHTIKKRENSNNKYFLWLIILLAVFLILFVVAFQNSSHEKITLVSDPPFYYEISVSDPVNINLNDFFVDPDNDTLEFAANTSSGIKISIENEIANIKALPGVVGIESAKFTAKDSYNSSAESPLISFNVKKKEQLSLATSYRDYCALYYLVPLFIIVIFTYIYFLEKDRVLKTKKNKNEPPYLP